jgi:signal transduction histidine kinase
MLSGVETDEKIFDADNAIEHYRRNALFALQVAFLVAAAVGLVLFYRLPVVLAATVTSCFLSAASLMLTYRHRLSPAVVILAIQFLLLPTSLALAALGIYDSAMLILPAGMVALAIVTTPAKSMLFVAASLAAAGIVFYATTMRMNGMMPPPEWHGQVVIDGITVLLILMFCGIVSTYISVVLSGLLQALARQHGELERRVQMRTAALTQSNDQLRATLETLERAKDDLVQSEKLASLGSLVAGVAHELNTPIGNAQLSATTVQHHLSTLQLKIAAGELRRSEMQQLLQSCEQGTDITVQSIERARDLVASFKQVAVDQASERRREFDLKKLVTDVLRTLRPGLSSKDYVLEEEVQDQLLCNGYPGPLIQVLTNLIQNAVLHGFKDRPSGHVQVRGQRLDAGQMRITVADDGGGIAADAIDHIFEPFFTTRLGTGGSGIGLTISQNLVTSLLGGRIEVQSQAGSGTTFILTLPVNAPEPHSSTATPKA